MQKIRTQVPLDDNRYNKQKEKVKKQKQKKKKKRKEKQNNNSICNSKNNNELDKLRLMGLLNIKYTEMDTTSIYFSIFPKQSLEFLYCHVEFDERSKVVVRWNCHILNLLQLHCIVLKVCWEVPGKNERMGKYVDWQTLQEFAFKNGNLKNTWYSAKKWCESFTFNDHALF